MDNEQSENLYKSESIRHLQSIARLVEENYQLEKDYQDASSKLSLLSNRVSNLNHDLRCPLLGIMGLIDLIVDESTKKVQVQSSDLLMIKKSAESILDFMTNCISETDEDAQSIKHDNSLTDVRQLSSVMHDVDSMYLPMAKNKGITLTLNTLVDSKVLLPMSLYNNLIKITGNLVANGIKFTRSPGSVTVDFKLAERDDMTHLMLTIKDTGVSMSGEKVSAFNKGMAVERSAGTDGEESYGFGLQHVIEMVSEERGHIQVESNKEAGTKFVVSFPLSEEHLTQIPKTQTILTDGVLSQNGHQT